MLYGFATLFYLLSLAGGIYAGNVYLSGYGQPLDLVRNTTFTLSYTIGILSLFIFFVATIVLALANIEHNTQRMADALEAIEAHTESEGNHG
jgi:cbb3-type cytochrome oxidase subunit 3